MKIVRLTCVVLSMMCIMLCCSSCVSSYQLNQTAIVQAIGIDKENELFQVTFQIYSPKGAGASTAIDTSKNNSSIVTGSGETLAAAVRAATQKQGKVIFTGHNRILVIGRLLAQEGIENIFSYFNRNALTRQNVQVLMAENTAEEIVTTNIEQGILAAETIRNLIENTQTNGKIYECPYFELSKNMNLYHGASAMPVIAKEAQTSSDNNQEGDQGGGGGDIPSVAQIKVEKTAIFNDYKLCAELDEEQTRGLLFLKDEIQKTILVANSPNTGKCSIDIYSCQTKLEPVITGQTLSFVLKGKIKASLDEVIAFEDGTMTAQDIVTLEEACKEIIQQEAQRAFTTIVNQNQSDILYLENMVLKKDKHFWEKHQEEFLQMLKEISLQTELDFQIDRSGLETNEYI